MAAPRRRVSPVHCQQPLLHAARLACLIVPLAFTATDRVGAQAGRPTAEQAQQMLQERPDLVARLRQTIETSGLTADQIRDRLRQNGYPESLLDPYFPNSTTAPDSSRRGDVLSAVRRLGIADSSDVSLFQMLSGDTSRVPIRRRTERDSTRVERPRYTRDGLTVFGLDLFGTANNQFEANLAGPVDATYRLGPGDQLVLILTGDVEAAYTLDVTREGFVVIPQVGQVPVANLTLGELESLLYTRLGRAYSGVRRGDNPTTRFSVSVARLRVNQVIVAGDVVKPGSVRVSSAGTALTALYAAGGPSERGTFRRILIRRGGKVVSTLDLYDYLLAGDASADMRLLNGDVVFVPSRGPRARIVGEVVRPATYELEDGQTLAELIQAAGGFTAEAGRGRVQIERIVPASARTQPGRDRVMLDVNAGSLDGGGAAAIPLADGDVVRVFPVADRLRNRITVIGNVWSPGEMGLNAGMTLEQAIRRAGGIKPDTYLGQVLVSRLRADSTREQLRAVLRDSTGAVVTDFPLREDDEVRLFSVSDFRPDRYVAISGAVMNPGRFRFTAHMTMRDLVLMAGGLEQSALLTAAEIARLPENRANGATAETFRAPLDSTYLFERALDGTYQGPPGIPAPSARSPDVELQPYDHVLILRQPDWQLQRMVTITGEVKYPGQYSLRTKTERLRDLVSRAGGLTPEGYAEGIRFFRKRDSIGRIGLDLPKVLRSQRDRDNLLLQDGDSVFIPSYSPVVTVGGAVNSPVAVAYVPGRDIDYYIRAAGGPSRTADPARAYVTQPNGSVQSRGKYFLFTTNPTPRAGSVVSVPDKDPNAHKDYVAMAGAVAQILASIVAIVVVATR